jgi:E3 ubiquitin-protein ligase listerin
MPRGGVRGSQSSAARAMVDSMGSPASLSAFLGGFSTGTDVATDVEKESEYAVNLKLLNKTSEITKQKAFEKVLELMRVTPEEALLQYAEATAEAVIQHAQHPKPAIRAFSFQLLQALMSGTTELKKRIGPELRVLAGLWVMGMNDMEQAVTRAASAAFDTAFTADKRTRMLQQFMDAILETLHTTVAEVMATKKPLQDDALEPNANRLYAALKSMGYMIKQVSASQPTVLKFVQDPETFGALVPARNTTKSYLLQKTPLARSAVLALLRDVVTICPATAKIHALVSQALVGSILDPNVAVASRTWELLLFWCRTNVADVVGNMKPGFLDDVVNCFMDCQQAELADVIYPCLFPLLTSLSKDSRCEGILDEFCAALVEKLHQVTETPNVSARDLAVMLSALLECWELHCVRKKTAGAPEDSVELFTVICFNLVLLMQGDAKAARYQQTAIKTVAKSLLKTGTRCEGIFGQCVAVVSARPSAAFSVLPDSPNAAERRSFERFQGHLLGHLCATLSVPPSSSSPTPASSTISKGDASAAGSNCTTSNSTSRCKALVVDVSNAWLLQQLTVKVSDGQGEEGLRYEQLASFFEETEGSAFCPDNEVADRMLAALSAYLRAASAASPPGRQSSSEDTAKQLSASESTPSPPSSTRTAALATLVTAALEWKHRPAAQALVEATSATQEQELKEAALRHMLRDPMKLFGVFMDAVLRLDADRVERCVLQYTERSACLSGEQREVVKKALRGGLKNVLAQLTEEVSDSDDKDTEKISENDDGGGSRSSTDSEDDENSASSEASSSSASADDDDSNSTGSSSAGSQRAENKAPVVKRTLLQWSPLLRAGSNFAELIALSKEDVAETLLTPLTHITVALSPVLYLEQFISVEVMRLVAAAQRQSLVSAAAGGEGAGNDCVLLALEAKKHGLGTAECASLTDCLKDVLDSYGVTREECDAVAMATLRSTLDESDTLPLCFYANHQLAHMAPFASRAYLQSFVTAESVWQETAMAVDTTALVANETTLSLYDGYLTLDLLRPCVTKVVRTGQLIRLMDAVDGPEAAVAMAAEDPKAVAHLFCELVRVAAAKEALSKASCHTLFVKTFPAMFACFDVAAVAVEVAAQLSSTEPSANEAAFPYLLPTLAAVLRDIATAEDTIFLRRAMRLVSAVTNAAVSALFSSEGARGIAGPLAVAYTIFYSTMDEAADMLRFNIAAQIPPERERLLLEASCQLTTWDITTAKLTLVVVRHLASLPAVADSTVRSLIQYAAKQTPLAGLELLAELSCTRIPSPDVYSELIRVIVDALCRSHRLRHLPPNGRLQKENGGSLAGGAPVALTTLRRVVMAAVLARRGVVLHSRMDSVLRSSVNVVVFDAVCEAVSRLRAAKEAEVAALTKLIAFTSRFMADLLTGDVLVLRASEVSVEKIASVLNFAYAWLFATSIKKLEVLGLSTVASVMRSVCLLSNLTLMRSTVSLRAAMRTIMQRPSLKPLREDYSTAEPAKIAQFRQQNTALAKTHKQKMLLFPYLQSWCIFVTTPAAAAADEAQSGSAARDKEWQRQVYALLDLLFTLMLTPLEKKARRLDETFIGASMHTASSADTSATGQLGFEVVALTRVDADDPMTQLARGAFAVFTQLLHGPTLSLTKSWLETIERKGRALFYDSVAQHISGILIQESFMSVLSHSPDGSSTFTVGEGCSVEVNVAQQLIDLSYEMEDAKVAVRITFPTAFPLRPPVVEHESGRECGVSIKKWRAWMLKMSVILFGGSANVWECIDLFHQNLDAHFRGIEPCPICFAVVSAVNHKLPDVRCSVCHNSAFHSNCLYTWWASGFNNVCPLCRSPWIAE